MYSVVVAGSLPANSFTEFNHHKLNLKFFKSMGDVSPDGTYHIKSRIGDQFILGYYDKDKHFNINRVINVTIKNQVFTID